jgi:hypothetical protein
MTHTESSRQQKFHTHKQKGCQLGEREREKNSLGLTQDADREGIVVTGALTAHYANEIAKRRKRQKIS